MSTHRWNEAYFTADPTALKECRNAYGNGPFALSDPDEDGFVVAASTVGSAWEQRPFRTDSKAFAVVAQTCDTCPRQLGDDAHTVGEGSAPVVLCGPCYRAYVQ